MSGNRQNEPPSAATRTARPLWESQVRRTGDYCIRAQALRNHHARVFDAVGLVLHSPDVASRAAACDELARRLRRHFMLEESVMRSCGYPELTSHTTAHARLLERLARLRARLSGDELDLMELGTLVEAWQGVHVRRDDQRLADYLDFGETVRASL